MKLNFKRIIVYFYTANKLGGKLDMTRKKTWSQLSRAYDYGWREWKRWNPSKLFYHSSFELMLIGVHLSKQSIVDDGGLIWWRWFFYMLTTLRFIIPKLCTAILCYFNGNHSKGQLKTDAMSLQYPWRSVALVNARYSKLYRCMQQKLDSVAVLCAPNGSKLTSRRFENFLHLFDFMLDCVDDDVSSEHIIKYWSCHWFG